MLASHALTTRPLQARPRLEGAAAAAAARRSLGTEAGELEIDEPGLVFYPFLLERTTRRPLRPLSQLPPAFAKTWEASGSDLVFDATDEAVDEISRTASRIPMSKEPPPGSEVVFYPFFRVPVRVGEENDAVWVDAVDGQVMAERAPAPADRKPTLTRWLLPALAVGAASGLLLPFPMSLLPAGGAAVWAWRRAEKA
jgi:hypothetical protein